jgi:capsular polysaccharide biosynthesis protein
MDAQSQTLLRFLYEWRKPLLLAPVIAGIVAAIASTPIFIQPLYESIVTVFPATTNSPSKALLPQNSYQDEDFLEFGAEEQAEQLIQILNSDAIFDTIVERFDLIRHYDLDTTSKTLRTDLWEEYSDKISFQRTQFMSVEIRVLDTDPQLAADIANAITDLLDRAKSRIQRSRAQVGLKIVQREYDKIREDMRNMEDEIKTLRKKGVHEYEGQSMVVSDQLATAIAEGRAKSAIQELKNTLDTLAKYGGRYVSLRDELRLRKEEEVKLRTKLDQVRVDAQVVLPATHRVNAARPADKKKYPIRWLICAVSGIAAFVSTLIAILLANTWKDLRSQLPS